MALITRFSRLFTADLNAVLDRLEEPEILLKQALRDMDDELARMRDEVRSSRLELRRLEQQDGDVAGRISAIDAQLDVCFDSGEDTLARNLIRRKLEAERSGKSIATRRDALTERIAELDAAIAENTEHLAAMREKVELFDSHPGARRAGPDVDDHAIGADEIEVAFLRERQRRAAR